MALSKAVYQELPEKDQDPLARSLGFRSFELKSDRIRLHCVESGPQDDSDPLIFLHGFPEFWFSWRHQLAGLGKKRRCIAVDLRGYHRSARPASRSAYRMEELLADLDDLLVGLGLSSATWVAHDWGGAIAWTFAGERPGQVKRLAVLNMPHPALFRRGLLSPVQLKRSAYVFFFQLPFLPERFLSEDRARRIASAFSSMWVDRPTLRLDDLEPYRAQSLGTGALTAMLNYYRNVFRPSSVFRKFPVIHAPVGIFWGTQDRALGKELLEGTRNYAPRAEITLHEGASHWVQQEKPEEVNAWLESWLARTTP